MTYLLLIVAVVVWIGCGVLAYGLNLAYFQGKYPNVRESEDRKFALTVALFGPIGLFVCLVMGGTKYGLQFQIKDPKD